MIIYVITQFLISTLLFYIYQISKIPFVLSFTILINGTMAIGIVQKNIFKKSFKEAKYASFILLLIIVMYSQLTIIGTEYSKILEFIWLVILFILNGIMGAISIYGFIDGFKGDK